MPADTGRGPIGGTDLPADKPVAVTQVGSGRLRGGRGPRASFAEAVYALLAALALGVRSLPPAA
jgi:hypothetical protein